MVSPRTICVQFEGVISQWKESLLAILPSKILQIKVSKKIIDMSVLDMRSWKTHVNGSTNVIFISGN